jgi:Subtilisin inhibitor-like
MGMKPSLRHARSAAGYLLPVILCVITAAACGSVNGTSAASSTGTSPAPRPSAPAAKISLTVVVTPTPGATPKRWTLRCEPTGGTDPDAKAACRELLAAKNPFAPIPRGIMCPMIVAGPQKATVSGIFFGQHVDSDFSRAGCEGVRWAKLGAVFGPVGTGVASGSPVH